MSASVHAGIAPGCGPGDPPECGPGDPPTWVWAWRPPLGVGLETPPGQTPQFPIWVWAWRPSPYQTPQFPPWVWALEILPRPDPSTSPLGVGPGDPPQARPLNFSIWVWALEDPLQARPLNFPLGVGLETCNACWNTTPPTPHCAQNDRHA